MTVAEIVQRSSLSRKAHALQGGAASPGEYVAVLRKQGLEADALQVLCHWLPTHERAWWGCLCLWHATRTNAEEATATVLRAVVRWLQKPSPERLQLVAGAAEAAGGHDSAAGRLALATADVHEPLRASYVLLSAVVLATTLGTPQVLRDHFLDLGLEVARGENRWA